MFFHSYLPSYPDKVSAILKFLLFYKSKEKRSLDLIIAVGILKNPNWIDTKAHQANLVHEEVLDDLL
jgi:hypothetical protein